MRDMMLDHAPSRGAGASYDHNEYIEPMTGEFEKWAAHIEGIIAADHVRVLR